MSTSSTENCIDMTEEVIIQQCKLHQGYRTPELNEKLYLHHLGFKKISSLDAFHQCTVLYLNNNVIDNLEGLQPLKKLHALYLSNNSLQDCQRLPPLPSLRLLDISSNSITSFEGLSNAPDLEILLASRNSLKNLNGLELLDSLLSLDVSLNMISNVDDILPLLFKKETLRTCILHGNRFIRDMPSYRKTVIVHMPSLQFLDQYPVSPEERSCAEAFAVGGAEAEQAQREENERKDEEERQRQFCYFGKVRAEARGRRMAEGPRVGSTVYFDDNNAEDIYVPKDLHSFLTPYIQDVWGGKTLFQFRQEHNRVEEAPASTAAEQMNHQLRADEESGRAAQQTAEKTHLSFKERAAKAMRERAAQMTFLKTLEGCYESVYNAKWHHIVETPGGGEGIGMEVKQGKPQKSWTYKKCISFEVGDEADQFSAPRCRLMVLTSEKGWPYSWFFSNVIPDCYVNYEVERVWQVIQADLTGKFDKKNNEESRVLRRVLIGTPGIGKGMAAGSYLLYQLLHCNATRLDVVVYGFGNVAFVFDKITKTVRSYKTFDEAKRHLEGMSARGMSGHIIYVLAPEEGEYNWKHLMPSFEWGMTAVSPPVRKCYHYFEEDMNALKIVMNCPTENDMKAMCAWMKRHQCEAAQAAHWSTIKSHITHIGPIPRDVFGREYAHQRLSDVQVAINGMDFSTCEGYGELKRFLYRPDRHPYGELMKYFRRNTDRGMEVDKFTSLSVPVRAKILACLARTIKSPDCRHPLLDETDRVFSTYLEVYGVCTFVYDRFVENIHKKIVALPPPTGCEPRHCVLRVDPQLCPRVPTALLPKWFHQRKSVVSHGVLYIQGVEEHPLFDAFFFVDSPRKTIVGLRTERAEPHNNNNITACAVKQFKECLAEYFKDWEEFAQDLSWEMIHVQDANSPSINERDICTTTRCANETPREEKEEEEDATVEFWDRKVYQHTLKIEREDVAAIHRQ